MEIEVPERAQYIRLILTEMARISSHFVFNGAFPLEIGALTPIFLAMEDRERVLDLLESVTGGRFHPNFNRCLLYTSPSPRDISGSRMPSSA